jgi:hypothetical protein
MNDITIPTSPFGTKLRGKAALADYYLQDRSPQAVRRIGALCNEVREENRIPHFIDGDGEVCSYTKWLDAFQLARAKHLVVVDAPAGNDPPRMPPCDQNEVEVTRHRTKHPVATADEKADG